MDFQAMMNRMTKGDKVLAGGLLLMIIGIFPGWVGASCSGAGINSNLCGSITESGMAAGWGWFYILATLALVALYVLRNFPSVKLPAMPLTDSMMYMIGGAVGVATVALTWLTNHQSTSYDPGFGIGGYSSSIGLSVGAYIALAASIITIVGGFLKQNDPQPMSTASTASYPPSSYSPPPPPAPPAAM